MKKRIVAIIALALLLRMFFFSAGPFYKDEALYAEIVDEMLRQGTSIPTYAGLPVPWKPPMTFWLYSAFAFVLSPLGLPPEITYRIPGMLLGALCPVLTYLIIRMVSADDDLAFISALAYAGNGLAIAVNELLLTDTVLSAFILASVFFYLKAKQDSRFALLGGAFSAAAILTKTLVGLLGPVLGIAYLYLADRQSLLKRDFLLSLLMVPLSFALLFFLMPGFSEQSILDMTQRTSGPETLGYSLGGNMLMVLILSLPWVVLAIYGAYRYRKETRPYAFWCLWGALCLFPLVVPGPLFWYFLPLLPAMSIFSSKVVLAGSKADAFTYVFLGALLLLSASATYIYTSEYSKLSVKGDSKGLGEYLAGKDALLVSQYNPTVLYYRFHSDSDFSSLDAVFLLNHTSLSDEQLLSVLSGLPPGGSLELRRALLGHYLPRSMHLGEFASQKEFVALSRDIYAKRISGKGLPHNFTKEYESEGFVVLRR